MRRASKRRCRSARKASAGGLRISSKRGPAAARISTPETGAAAVMARPPSTPNARMVSSLSENCARRGDGRASDFGKSFAAWTKNAGRRAASGRQIAMRMRHTRRGSRARAPAARRGRRRSGRAVQSARSARSRPMSLSSRSDIWPSWARVRRASMTRAGQPSARQTQGAEDRRGAARRGGDQSKHRSSPLGE